MKQLLLTYVPLSLWWLGYIFVVMLIGWAAWSACLAMAGRRWKTLPALDNPWLTALVWMMSGVATIGLVSVPFYLFGGSAGWFTIGVALLTFIAAGLLGKQLWRGRSRLEASLRRLIGRGYQVSITAHSLLVMICSVLLLGFVIADGVFSMVRLSHLADGSDANVHLSRVVDMTENGFSIRDGFMQGIDETRYAINFIYTLFIPVTTTAAAVGVAPYEIAAVTPVFFRSLQMLAIGALAFGVMQLLLGKRKGAVALAYSASAAAVVVGMLLNHFAYSFYPNIVVFTWYVVLFFALLWQSDDRRRQLSYLLLGLSAVTIAGTHATYAIMAGLLIALVRGVYFVEDLVRRRSPFTTELWVSVAAVVVLLLPGVFVFLQPNLMTEQAINTESAIASVELFGVRVFPPRLGLTQSTLWNSVQLIGTLGLIVVGFRRSFRAGVLVAIVLGISLITASNPLFVSVMNAAHIPYWVMSRFPSLNIFLTYSLPIVFGLIFVGMGASWLARHWPQRRSVALLAGGGTLVVIGLIGISIMGFGLATQRRSQEFMRFNYTALETFRRLDREVMRHIGNRQLVLASHYTSYYLPVVKPSTVVYTDALHMPPGGDAGNRQQCQNQLFAQLDRPEVVRGAGIQWVVVDPYGGEEVTEERLAALRRHPGDYTEVLEPGIYRVFRVQPGSAETTAVCKRFEQREAGQR